MEIINTENKRQGSESWEQKSVIIMLAECEKGQWQENVKKEVVARQCWKWVTQVMIEEEI